MRNEENRQKFGINPMQAKAGLSGRRSLALALNPRFFLQKRQTPSYAGAKSLKSLAERFAKLEAFGGSFLTLVPAGSTSWL
jgi:hypothetical protein